MTRRLAASLLATVAVALACAATSDAYVIGGRAWPKKTVTYHSAARGYAKAVDRAARLVNRARLGVRLRRRSRARADVVVAYRGRPCEGSAYLGYLPRRRNVVFLGRPCRRGLVTLTAVHEFGHVLGLGHERRRCARMNPSIDGTGTPSHCARRSLSFWLGHPFRRDDIRGLRAIYRRGS
jgi:hypothetical protein